MKVDYIVQNSCKYADDAHSRIDLMVKFSDFAEAVPFTASEDDVEGHGRLLWRAASSGEAGDVALFVPPPLPPFIVFKGDIWRRCTDDEAATLDAALSQQPVRLKRLFNDATLLQSDDELFGAVQQAVSQLLGPDRAAIVLAPSE